METAPNGILMVMMENYDEKKQRFLPSGKLAVGIKYTKDGIEIACSTHVKTRGYTSSA